MGTIFVGAVVPPGWAVSLLSDMGVSPDAVVTEPETLTREAHRA
jgi:hypothetical protein